MNSYASSFLLKKHNPRVSRQRNRAPPTRTRVWYNGHKQAMTHAASHPDWVCLISLFWDACCTTEQRYA
jgi:hypothetical protein